MSEPTETHHGQAHTIPTDRIVMAQQKPVRARQAASAGHVNTWGGFAAYLAGDWIIDDGPMGYPMVVTKALFDRTYDIVEDARE